MSSTASTFIDSVNINFPIPGQDNDSQTFRNNWVNITQALKAINTQTDYLAEFAVLTTATTSTFYGNTIADVTLQNASLGLWDNGTVTGDVTIDYTQGNYQKIELTAGSHNISVTNWARQGTAGQLTLSITPTSTNPTTVNFVGTTPLGPSTNPYLLSPGINIFQLYSEYPTLSNGSTVLVQYLNELIVGNTSTNIQTANTLTLVNPNGDSSANYSFSVSATTGSNNATLVSSVVSGNVVLGNVAVVPNFVTKTILGGIANPGYSTATIIQLSDLEGLAVGATFIVDTTSTIQTIVGFGVDTITCSPGFPDGIGFGNLTFRNPAFSDFEEPTAYPIIATMSSTPANTATGTMVNHTGAIYANKNYLEVTYGEFGDNSTNTFIAQTLAVTTASDKSSTLANTNFVHQVLPYGSIIMWYGNVSSIPYGWKLCDGTGGTPNLINKFVVGAGVDNAGTATTTITGSSSVTGGRTDTVLPDHNHDIADPQHSHNIQYYSGGAFTGGSAGTSPTGVSTTIGTSSATEPASTGIAVTGALSNTATVVANPGYDNLPPYYAICYIMKVTG